MWRSLSYFLVLLLGLTCKAGADGISVDKIVGVGSSKNTISSGGGRIWMALTVMTMQQTRSRARSTCLCGAQRRKAGTNCGRMA